LELGKRLGVLDGRPGPFSGCSTKFSYIKIPPLFRALTISGNNSLLEKMCYNQIIKIWLSIE